MNKPLLVDFNGWACVNSRKMEQQTVYTPRNSHIIQQNFIVATLYVDDRSPLPDIYSDWKNLKGEPFENYGDLWIDLEINLASSVTQPTYLIVDNEGEIINDVVNYQSHKSEEEFRTWLLQSLKKFKNK